MNRKKFLSYSALGVAGVLLNPAIGFPVQSSPFKLPKANVHGRHGYFNLDEFSGFHLSRRLRHFRLDIFCQDGIEEGTNDMILMSYLSDEQKQTHFINRNELYTFKNREAKTVKAPKERLLMVFEGSLSVNNQTLNAGEGIFLNEVVNKLSPVSSGSRFYLL
ncbi:MAG: hypothetical protein MI810_00750 [Flavobacteriales bacterium]|nr:hypothetical protein [Flavobacteriales bacterium]